MKKIFTLLFLLASFFAFSQSTTVVISQIYGGGGGTSATYNSDYVELHNISAVPQNISGFKLAYGSSNGLLGSVSNNRFTFPANTIIPAGGYFLVADSGLTGGLSPLPVARDLYFSFAMSATKGKIALGTAAFVDSASLTSQPAGAIIDFIGYGPSASEFEGAAPTAATTNLSAAIRNNNGCDDSNQNGNDFTIGTPNPRNSATPVFICGSATNPTLAATTLASFGNVCITNPTAASGSFSVSGSNLTAGNITVGPLTGYTFATASAGPYTSTVTVAQTGTLASTTIYVNFTPTAAQSYNGNIAVSGGGAASINVAVTGSGVSSTAVTTGAASGLSATGATISGTLTQGCSAATSYGIEYSTTSGFTPGTGTVIASTNLSGSSYTASLAGLTPSTTYYFIAYAVTASGTIYGTQGTFTTPPQSASTAEVVISQVYGGGGASSGISYYTEDYVELHNTASTAQDISGFKLLYGSAAGLLGSYVNNRFVFPANTIIPAGGYLLVATANNPDSTVGDPLPVSADFTFGLNMSRTSGKVAFGTSSMLDSVSLANQPAGAVVDFVGYGTATEFEGAAGVAALDTLHAAFRNNNGCTDTDDNLSDFTINTPLPRNSTSPVYICGATTNPTLTATTLASFNSVCVNTTAPIGSFNLSGSDLTSGDLTVGPLDGYAFSLSNAGPFTSTVPVPQTGGTLNSTTIFVQFTPTAVQSYNGNIAISGGGAAVINVAASGSGAGSTSVASAAAASITSSSAVVAGTLTAGCTAVTSYGIQYSTTSGFTPGTGTIVASTNLSGSSYSSALSGLAASTTYYYIAYAVTATGTLYGTESSFTTTAIVTTPALSATALASFGDICVNTTTPANSFSISGSDLTTGDITVGPLAGYAFATSATGTYTSTLTITQTGGTLAATTVYVQFTPTAAQTYDGNISISGGGATASVAASGSGTTSSLTVATLDSSSITSNSAVLHGSVVSGGCGGAVTEWGIEYSSIQNFPAGSTTKIAATGSQSGYTVSVSNLIQNTTYYYRAYANNGGSYVYGEQKLFFTGAINTGLSVNPNPIQRGGNFTVTLSGIKAGQDYSIRLFNSAGQLVFQQFVNAQVNFIEKTISVPAKLAPGLHILQVASPDFRIEKPVIVQ